MLDFENQMIFNQLGLRGRPSEADIKAAYRKLSLVCHPDTKTDNAPYSFVELTTIYEKALRIVKDNAPPRINETPMPEQPPTPHTAWVQASALDDFEILNFGKCYRDIVVPAYMKDGGSIQLSLMEPSGTGQTIQFNIWPTNGSKDVYLMNTPMGPLEVTVFFA